MGRSLTRRGHSDSAWQSCHDMQTWLTTASCCISNRATTRMKGTVGQKGRFLDIWLFCKTRERFIETGGYLSITFVCAPCADETEHPERKESPRLTWEKKFKGCLSPLEKSGPVFFVWWQRICEVLWQDFRDSWSPFACKTDMNDLDVASLLSAPTAALFLAVTCKERTIFFLRRHR